MNAPAADLGPFVDDLGQARRREAIGRTMRLVDAGTAVTDVVEGLLRPAQREVGERWARNEWSVAEEHAATAIVDVALTVLASNTAPAVADGPHVVVGCAEGDLHALPTRMLAEMLGQRGFEVTYLGASLPPDHLASFVATVQPTAVAVGCAVPVFLPGAARTIAAAQGAGVPVIVGGAAFGSDDRRARHLGADAWGADLDGIEATLRSWAERPVAVEVTAVVPPEVATAADEARAWGLRAFELLIERLPILSNYTQRQLRRTIEDLGYLVEFAAAAVLVDDDRLWDDFLAWHVALLEARGVPRHVMPPSFEALLAIVPEDLTDVRAHLERGVTQTAD